MKPTAQQLYALYWLIESNTTLQGKPLLAAYVAQQGLVEGCLIVIFGGRQVRLEGRLFTDPEEQVLEYIIFEDGEVIAHE
ncbi:MAG: hypothetical protein ACFB4I_23570 [Cyanophyceae cyanobacterium]